MNFAALKQEVADRGFDYLPDARLGFFVNAGYHELNSADLWPWKFSTQTTASWTSAAIALSNAERVTSVATSTDSFQTSTNLAPRTAEDFYGWEDLTPGSPLYYVAQFTSTGLTVTPFPQSTTALGVRAAFYARATDMSATSDTPSVPSQYHSTIVDIACREAYADSDNYEAAQALQAGIDRDVERIRRAVLQPSYPTAGGAG